jgi:hypothetical protein
MIAESWCAFEFLDEAKNSIILATKMNHHNDVVVRTSKTKIISVDPNNIDDSFTQDQKDAIRSAVTHNEYFVDLLES